MKSLVIAATIILLQLPAGSSASKCEVTLNDDKNDCLAKCMMDPYHGQARDIFVCDLTNPWLHHSSSNPEWLPATPPEGTGTHEYAVFQQGVSGPPPCAGALGRCHDCAAPTTNANAHHLCSVFVDPTNCKVTCAMEAVAASSSSSAATTTENFTIKPFTIQMEQPESVSSAPAGHFSCLVAFGAAVVGVAMAI